MSSGAVGKEATQLSPTHNKHRKNDKFNYMRRGGESPPPFPPLACKSDKFICEGGGKPPGMVEKVDGCL